MCNRIFISSLTTTDTGVVLIPNRQITHSNLTNGGKYELIIACGLKATNSLPIFIQTSSGNVPLLDKYANPIFSNQLKTRTKYCIGYGNENTNYTLGQFINYSNLCASCGTISSVSVNNEIETAMAKSTSK